VIIRMFFVLMDVRPTYASGSDKSRTHFLE